MSSANSILKYCPKCQVETERYGSGRCNLCERARAAVYTASHSDQIKARTEVRQTANPDRAREINAAWQAAHPGKAKARTAAYYAANKGKEKIRIAAWRAANAGKVKATAAAWQASNTEVKRIIEQNRRARKCENDGILSKGLTAKLFKLQKGKCPCCKQPLGEDYHMDHKMPLALGGPNIDDNMQLLRSVCNHQKSKKHPVDFMQSRGFLL